MFGFRKRRNAHEFAKELFRHVTEIPDTEGFSKTWFHKLTGQQQADLAHEWLILQAWLLQLAVMRFMKPSEEQERLLKGVSAIASQIAEARMDQVSAFVRSQERFIAYSEAWIKGPPKDESDPLGLDEFEDDEEFCMDDEEFFEDDGEFDDDDGGEAKNEADAVTKREAKIAYEDWKHHFDLALVLIRLCGLDKIANETKLAKDFAYQGFKISLVMTGVIDDIVPKIKIV